MRDWNAERVAGAALEGQEVGVAPDVLRPGLDAIRAPTLVIVGAEDTATPPAAAAALHQGIRGSRLVVIPNAAHLSPVEQPDAFNAAVRALLSA